MWLWTESNPDNLTKITSLSSEMRGEIEENQYFITNENNMMLL